MRPLEFGVNVRAVGSPSHLRGLVRRVDELGLDVLAVPDHLGGPGPVTTLAAAAMVSERLRLRTYVLNAGFWNAALLAREVATLDALSGGRAELGVGAGHMRSEYEDAGIPWVPHEERVEAMDALVVDVCGRLHDPSHRPVPVQRPVPVVIGAMSDAALRVAARRADVVAFAGARQVPGAAPGVFTLASADETRRRVAEVRRWAGGRTYRSDLLLQVVAVDRPPDQAAVEIAAQLPGLSATDVLDSPFLLVAEDAESAADLLLQRREEYGVDQVTTHQQNLEALGAVVAAVRRKGG